MKLLDLIITLKKQNDLSKILIFNDLTLTKQEIIEISQYFKLLCISFYNNFSIRNLFVQLRSYKNINVVEPNSIPNINYDLICSYELTNPILFILSKIKYVKYFYCTNSSIELNAEIPGFKKDPNIKNLYVKDNLILEINEKPIDNKTFKEELRDINKEKTEIFRNIEEKNKQKKNIVIIKNIVSTLTKFSNFKEESSINEGELDICCILSNKKDYDLFLKVIEYMNVNYSYVKYFIFLNGKTILKYFKEENFKTLNYVLIKSKITDDFKNTYTSIFGLLTNGSYKFYMEEINFETEMIDLL